MTKYKPHNTLSKPTHINGEYRFRTTNGVFFSTHFDKLTLELTIKFSKLDDNFTTLFDKSWTLSVDEQWRMLNALSRNQEMWHDQGWFEMVIFEDGLSFLALGLGEGTKLSEKDTKTFLSMLNANLKLTLDRLIA